MLTNIHLKQTKYFEQTLATLILLKHLQHMQHVDSVLYLAKEEAGWWSAAGAKGISLIST
jgi:hypothetical protein